MTMQHPVLILSQAEDEHVVRLAAELDRLGCPWVRFDPGDVAVTARCTATLRGDSRDMHVILPDGTLLLLATIRSIWYRRPTPLQAASTLSPLQRLFIEREARAGVWGLLRCSDALWINHPDAIRAAAYKPRQLALAQEVGLTIPQTLITNEPDAFHRFYEQCQGQVIYKLLGFPSYEVEDGAIASTYTSLVPEAFLKEADRIRATMHLFQEYQTKICDLRVIIIGKQVFAIEIHPLSEAAQVDFRQDYQALRYAVHHLPEHIHQAVMALVRQYSLFFAALDFLYTREGHYVFLEVNAVGQFGWLEQATGLPLFANLAHALATGHREIEGGKERHS